MNILADSLNAILEREPHLPARFYDVLFKLHPELSKMFGNPKRQAEMFARMLIAIVDRYEDRPWIDEQLARLATAHRKFGLTPEMYRSFNDALLVALEEAAGDEIWTPAVDEAWNLALEDIARTMLAA
jgi:hemoglobin-like flavoprotein